MAMDQGSKFGVSDGYFKMRSVLKDIFRVTGKKTVFVKDQVVVVQLIILVIVRYIYIE